MTTLDFTNSPHIELPFIDEVAARRFCSKGWSLSSVYYFSEIRDVYLALKKATWESADQFTSFCESVDLPFVKTAWNKRRIMEHVNALVNFSLVNSKYEIVKHVFIDSEIGAPLSQDDLDVFEEIYFSYFRFKEVFSWFIDPSPPSRLELVQVLTRQEIESQATPIFAFSQSGRFTDTWFRHLEQDTPLYYLRHKVQDSDGKVVTGNEDLMRFWDCFVVWGCRLGILEKFTLTDLGLRTASGKDIVCCYVISKNVEKVDLLEYLRKEFPKSHIYLPDLIFRLTTDFRMSLSAAHELLLEQYRLHTECLSFERTSEIFIKRGEIHPSDKILFPKYRDSYISHLVIRR